MTVNGRNSETLVAFSELSRSPTPEQLVVLVGTRAGVNREGQRRAACRTAMNGGHASSLFLSTQSLWFPGDPALPLRALSFPGRDGGRGSGRDSDPSMRPPCAPNPRRGGAAGMGLPAGRGGGGRYGAPACSSGPGAPGG